VTYTRDTSKITNPGGDELDVQLVYICYNPQPDTMRTWVPQTRGAVDAILASQGEYFAYIPSVFVQNGSYQKKHEVYIRDDLLRIYDSSGIYIDWSSVTGEGITVENAYDLEMGKITTTYGTKLLYKMK
jgi:hypothetical protein